MFKRTLTISDILLIVVNLVPVFGVWYEGWDANKIFLVYCMETIVIGIFNVFKMSAVRLFVKKEDVWNSETKQKAGGVFFILFFIAHYGLFVAVQTQIFFSMSNVVKNDGFFTGYNQVFAALGYEGKLMLAIFISYYTFDLLMNFFANGTYKTVSMGTLMFQPYLRIFVQQFVVILGAIFLMFNAGRIFILVFVLVRLCFELLFNLEYFLKAAEEKALKKASAQYDDVSG